MTLAVDNAIGWRSEAGDNLMYYVRDVDMWRLCVVFSGGAFQYSLLLNKYGALPIQSGPRPLPMKIHTEVVTLSPAQAMQNADEWWATASRLPYIYDAEPLETPNAS